MILLLLLMWHYLSDFALQNDFVATYKAKQVNGEYNPMWYHVLFAHCMIHSLGVLIITQNIYLTMFMLVTHFIIDYTKCERNITFNVDQLLHIVVICIIATLN